jgi:peptidoglycan hydrolase-like protein with peptidoglycan-binding domain
MIKQLGYAILLTGLTAACSGVHGDRSTASSNRTPANAEQLTVSKETVRQMQSSLQAKGFYSGPIDGIVGPEMRTAIANYQQSQGLAKSATVDASTIQALTSGNETARANATPVGNSGSSTPPRLGPDQIRQSVASQGYSNVTNVRNWGADNYAVEASKDGRTSTLGVDGRTGRIVSGP